MDFLRASLPKNKTDIEQGLAFSMRAKWMSKYRNVICSSVMMILILCGVCAYMTKLAKDDNVTPVEKLIRDQTPMEHPSHDHQTKFLGAILSATAKTFHSEPEVPEEFWSPCRRLSKVEMDTDQTLEQHKISDILLTMCRILHEQHGCEGEGSLPAKLIDIDPWINLCIITYKPSNGTCQHMVNPQIYKSANPTGGKLWYKQHHFPYVGVFVADREPQVLVTYHAPDNAYAQTTQGFPKSPSLFIQDAYDILMGTFPPRMQQNSDNVQ